jgi:hypothetical protein
MAWPTANSGTSSPGAIALDNFFNNPNYGKNTSGQGMTTAEVEAEKKKGGIFGLMLTMSGVKGTDPEPEPVEVYEADPVTAAADAQLAEREIDPALMPDPTYMPTQGLDTGGEAFSAFANAGPGRGGATGFNPFSAGTPGGGGGYSPFGGAFKAGGQGLSSAPTGSGLDRLKQRFGGG